MASYYTRSKVPRTSEIAPSECSDVEPSDIAPSAATPSLPPSTFAGPSVEAVGESESVSAELAGPVSAPILPFQVGSPPSSGSHGVLGPAGSPYVGVSARGYPSGLAGPPDSKRGGQMSASLATGIVSAESMQLEYAASSKLETSSLLGPSSSPSSSSPRQPPAAAAAARLPLEGPTLAPTYDRPTRRAHSLSARSSSSFRSLSPPVLSPAYVVDQPVSGLYRTGRTASSQRVVSPHARSQRAPILSPSAVGSDIEVEYPAARPTVFQPMPLSTTVGVDVSANVDRARPAAATVDVSASVGRTSLPYVDVDTRWPSSTAAGPATYVFAGAPSAAAGPSLLESATPSAAVVQPGSLGAASARTYTRSDTPIPLTDVGQRGLGRPMRIDVPRPLDLTLPVASGDVVHPCASLPVDVDIGRPAYDSSVPTASGVAYRLPPGNVDVIDVACAPNPSSVDVPRPTSASVYRPMPPMGTRQLKSSVPIDVVASLPCPPPLTRDVGLQGLGRPTSGDVAYYSGLPSVSVDAVRQPHSSLMGVDVVRPTSTCVDVVHPPSLGADATRPGTQPPSIGAGVVGPMPAHVAYPSSSQLGTGVDVASDVSRPTLADTRSGLPRPAYMGARVCLSMKDNLRTVFVGNVGK